MPEMPCNKIKFITLYCHLPRHIQRYYQDLISNEENTYDELIKLLKKRLAMPDHLKFQALHQLEAIGDRSPTQFLRDLRRKFQTAGEVSLTNLRYALALGLPPDLRNVKFSFDTKDLDTTALRVKELYNTTNKLSPSVDNIYSLCNNHVHSLQQPNGNLLVDRDQNTLTKWFINCSKSQWFRPWTNCHLKKKQSYSKLIFRNQQKNTSFTNSLPPTCPPTHSEHNKMGLCYYHTVFGNKANKCAGDGSCLHFNVPKCTWL